MVYRIIIIILLAAIASLMYRVHLLHRRLDHAEMELDIALRDGKEIWKKGKRNEQKQKGRHA